MARSWSNRKVTDYPSPAVMAGNRRSIAHPLTFALIGVVIFFMGLMIYVTVRQETNPPREQVQNNFAQPDEEK
ncbi:MAG: hypothetical protein ACLQVD_04610 [Capsulimonadaceae bacterium]